MTRLFATVGTLIAAVATGLYWVVYVIAGTIILLLIRDHGPDDPTITQLRRRQLNEFCRRGEVRR